MEGGKKLKKRGRKPKNVLSESKKKKTTPEITENLIIQLKKNVVDEYNILSYNKDESQNQSINNNGKSELCWNCCHSFNEHTFGIPMKYIHGIFYIYGDFCSLDCAARYAHDELKEYDFSEIFSLINLYSNIIYNKKEQVIAVLLEGEFESVFKNRILPKEQKIQFTISDQFGEKTKVVSNF